MEPLAPLVILAHLLAGLPHQPPPTPDLFIGLWRTDSVSFYVDDTTGNRVVPSRTSRSLGTLLVTAATIQPFSPTFNHLGFAKYYTRANEELLFDTRYKHQHSYVRQLCLSSFTLEETIIGSNGNLLVLRQRYYR